MDAAVAALAGAAIGALIGAVGSVGGVWLTQRHQTRRDLMRAAVELATAERREKIEQAQRRGGGPLPPVDLFVSYHARVLQAIADDRYGPELIRELEDAQTALLRAMPKRYDESQPR